MRFFLRFSTYQSNPDVLFFLIPAKQIVLICQEQCPLHHHLGISIYLGLPNLLLFITIHLPKQLFLAFIQIELSFNQYLQVFTQSLLFSPLLLSVHLQALILFSFFWLFFSSRVMIFLSTNLQKYFD